MDGWTLKVFELIIKKSQPDYPTPYGAFLSKSFHGNTKTVYYREGKTPNEAEQNVKQAWKCKR